jgi:hypothetical protein
VIARLAFVNWTIGFIAGTAIVWLTSPLFVRSYLPREVNRGVLTLPAGASYRWRAEGYASSSIGRFGMVGIPWSALQSPGPRIALWGDSQAEGVCVRDDQKIFSLANLGSDLIVLPLARSGDDASDWLQQIRFAENELGVSAHVFLVTELSDLATVDLDSVPAAQVSASMNAAIRWLPDFIIHAARNLLMQDDGVTPRRLRFSVGPVLPVVFRAVDPPKSTDWDRVLQSIQQATDQPVIIFYAPQLPSVVGNRVVAVDGDQESFARLQLGASSDQFRVVDLRARLRNSAEQGNWAHGFHNGRIGSGHLNRCGNQIVADAIVQAFQDVTW